MCIRDRFIRIYDDSSYQENIEDFLNSYGILEDYGTKGLFLLFAFHSNLNNQELNFETIMENIQKFKEARKNQKIEKGNAYYKENLEIVQSNNRRWNEGDTLDIMLPVRIRNNKRSAYHYIYPQTLDYSSVDDTLHIKGILICLLYTSPSPRDRTRSRMPSSA